MEYKVVYEINVDAASPLEAAKQVRDILTDRSGEAFAPQFYVQPEDSVELFSVDLEEDDEDAVLPVETYHPLIPIKNKR